MISGIIQRNFTVENNRMHPTCFWLQFLSCCRYITYKTISGWMDGQFLCLLNYTHTAAKLHFTACNKSIQSISVTPLNYWLFPLEFSVACSVILIDLWALKSESTLETFNGSLMWAKRINQIKSSLWTSLLLLRFSNTSVSLWNRIPRRASQQYPVSCMFQARQCRSAQPNETWHSLLTAYFLKLIIYNLGGKVCQSGI